MEKVGVSRLRGTEPKGGRKWVIRSVAGRNGVTGIPRPEIKEKTKGCHAGRKRMNRTQSIGAFGEGRKGNDRIMSHHHDGRKRFGHRRAPELTPGSWAKLKKVLPGGEKKAKKGSELSSIELRKRQETVRNSLVGGGSMS